MINLMDATNWVTMANASYPTDSILNNRACADLEFGITCSRHFTLPNVDANRAISYIKDEKAGTSKVIVYYYGMSHSWDKIEKGGVYSRHEESLMSLNPLWKDAHIGKAFWVRAPMGKHDAIVLTSNQLVAWIKKIHKYVQCQ